MSDVTLSKAVRSNLLHLQNTAKMMDSTQERLATGKKVNSALDNPTNFFTASSLNARAADIGTLLDAMSNGIQTIEAADNGLTAITKAIESMQSTLRQARQDKSFEVFSYELDASYAGGANPGEFEAGSEITFLGGAGIEDPGTPGDPYEFDLSGMTLDQAVSAINSDPELAGKVRASNDNGKLRVQNISTQALTVDGITSVAGGTIEGNSARANLAKQFNESRSEVDRLAEDASYNGVNLLAGDQLKIIFNEMGTSLIEIETKDAQGNPRPINSNQLGLLEISEMQLDSDDDIDGLLHDLQLALGQVRSQASDLGSTLSVVQNRESFTKNMINTLETGAANLTLADTNEEAANMLALQTRQQLSQTALSLASQSDQAVLRLFG